MGMLCTLINVEVVEQATAEGAFGQHTLHGVAQHLVDTVLALTQLCRRVETLTARIARVAGVDLVSLFLTSEYHLIGVDKDNVVAAVDVRSESWLVLSADELSYL